MLCPAVQGCHVKTNSDPGSERVMRATQVASLVGVTEGYIGQRCRGGGAQSDTSAKHARFAAACALNALLCEQSAVVVEEHWGLPSTLTQQGQSTAEHKRGSGMGVWGGWQGRQIDLLVWVMICKGLIQYCNGVHGVFTAH